MNARDDSALLTTLVERFEEAWNAGSSPSLEEFLPADASQRGAALAVLAHLDLTRRLQAGEPARIEAYLARFPELAHNRQGMLALIAAEFDLRQRREPGLHIEE